MVEELIWHSSQFSLPDEEKLGQSLPHALAKALLSWPDQPAILHGSQLHTFHDLARRAAGLAEEIEQTNSGATPIGLLLSVGLDSVAAWFACALAGRAFVLLEPDQPPKRLQELIDAAACSMILCDALTSRKLPAQLSVKSLISDGRMRPMDLNRVLEADRMAMIFPTSGSTGAPKMIAYAAITLQVKIQASIQLMRVPAGARVHIASSHANYGFLHHALVFLFSGGGLCLSDVKADGFQAISTAILRLGARHVRFTPSLFRSYARSTDAPCALCCLEAVRFSGEPLLRTDLELAKSMLRPECLIQNIYGSTESALFIWSDGDEMDDGATIPIGNIYPLSSYALQRPIEFTPDDEAGRLLIRSAYHALGELDQGVMHQARALPCPDGSGEKVYDTGDLVKRLHKGGLVHLGRTNRMVKIRGQRVFLDEIEHHLLAMPGVTGAAVVERSDGPTTTLCGFITADSPDYMAQEARTWLSSRLPDFMVPRFIVVLSEIPRMPGGKVDYGALRYKVPTSPNDERAVEPGTDDYGSLIQTWDSLLWQGAHLHRGDFASLGGDSLKVMQLLVEMERKLGRTFSINDFVKDSTLGNLGKLLGIEMPQSTPSQPGELVLRNVLSAREPCLGIALAMPGWSGFAHAIPFSQAEIFTDHDLWAADFRIEGESILEKGQWWKAAVAIVEQIKAGTLPTPRVIFGYSAGGSIAWLVSRLLAGKPQCPAYVIMVDASPLHRLPHHWNEEVDRMVALASAHAPPSTIHLCRPPLPGFGAKLGNNQAWKPEDHVHHMIELPTTEHSEMGRHEILKLGKQAVTDFIHGRSPVLVHQTSLIHSGIYGMMLYEIISGSRVPGPSDIEAVLKEMPQSTELGSLLGFLSSAVEWGGDQDLQAIIEACVARYPRAPLVHYLKYRLRRDPVLLCPTETPRYFPDRLRNIELTLARRQDKTRSIPHRRIRQAIQLVDGARAVLAAKAARSLRR